MSFLATQSHFTFSYIKEAISCKFQYYLYYGQIMKRNERLKKIR